jgi:hypothetical protein
MNTFTVIHYLVNVTTLRDHPVYLIPISVSLFILIEVISLSLVYRKFRSTFPPTLHRVVTRDVVEALKQF